MHNLSLRLDLYSLRIENESRDLLSDPSTPPHYAFEHAVHDDYAGTHFGHSEARDGYKTEGKYFVHLPDGRVQTVTYYADETGYHPTVSYEGTAHYDAHAAAPARLTTPLSLHITPHPPIMPKKYSCMKSTTNIVNI
nr:pro-resilin-like [Penaeus vannamei]